MSSSSVQSFEPLPAFPSFSAVPSFSAFPSFLAVPPVSTFSRLLLGLAVLLATLALAPMAEARAKHHARPAVHRVKAGAPRHAKIFHYVGGGYSNWRWARSAPRISPRKVKRPKFHKRPSR